MSASEDNLRANGLGWTHKLGSLTTQLDLEEPGSGIFINSGDSLISILGICLPKQALAFSDGWVRGSDATGVYTINDARELKISGLWRLQGTWVPKKDRDNSITAELILSSETLREKSDGALAVECSFLATSAQNWKLVYQLIPLGTRFARIASEYWSQKTGQTVTVQSFHIPTSRL